MKRSGFKRKPQTPTVALPVAQDGGLTYHPYQRRGKSAKRPVAPKKPSVSKIKKECDKLIKDIIKIRDKNICQRCGKLTSGSDCHGSHVIPVSAGNKLAFDEMNLKVLCTYHHLQWWHKNPIEASAWFEKKFPDRAAYLEANRGIKQMKLLDWLQLRDKLRERYAEVLNVK